MDPVRKAEIMSDLKNFACGESFYTRTGRAWKRGYLLYGPPGTGKSSMIAAMANYLEYDIYDLELTQVQTNSELRKLLMKTTSKSIIVIEDIDCSVNLTNRKETNCSSFGDGESGFGEVESSGNNITLSGLLNFTDGLWSCCGSERIFVFTTNHVEKLDRALLRSGRMDVHVFMSYCCYESLKILIKNYLGCTPDDVEAEVLRGLEEVIGDAEITPADVSEALIKNRRDYKKALRELVEVLRVRAGINRGGLRRVGAEVAEEEKRALESPEEGCDAAGGGGCVEEERWKVVRG